MSRSTNDTTSTGLHHVTAISGEARRNRDFYTRVLGLRLVKKTVNFDDPGTYHLYFGDAAGAPGTILTFFPWANAAPGRAGAGETGETAFRVPKAAIGFWLARFVRMSVDHEGPATRFGRPVVTFRDPDGMRLALVGVEGAEDEPAWAVDGIEAAHAIRGFESVTLEVGAIAGTAAVLTRVFGLAETAREAGRVRFEGTAAVGAAVELVESAAGRPRLGAGSVHHVAFRAGSDAAQAAMAEELAAMGLPATEQKDRNYFRSIYFREPGGVLFEIATDEPGFAADEPADSLGEALKLPAFLEPQRARIEAVLPPL
ncbi:ring-cleaving dioxygenase [Salinarimonas chemoclinalis]|uniref:ring-cleaving dioxygenase n=1 Tax=Salinarimonas chemoclinalis TaxID=3241599 RepID=UPI00355748D8